MVASNDGGMQNALTTVASCASSSARHAPAVSPVRVSCVAGGYEKAPAVLWAQLSYGAVQSTSLSHGIAVPQPAVDPLKG
jgi:hypothetical protein